MVIKPKRSFWRWHRPGIEPGPVDLESTMLTSTPTVLVSIDITKFLKCLIMTSAGADGGGGMEGKAATNNYFDNR